MNARLKKLLAAFSDTFWVVPGLLVLGGIALALILVQLDRSGVISKAMIQSAWLYSGGATGARTLLGSVASSTISTAGTIFSITIAALSLAAGQMGPRLLRNFTRDRGNQVTLGIFLGTFTYTLMVLRTVRTRSEGEFVPHLSLTVDIVLAFCCVATLVYFVGHMAGRINVDTVVDLVSDDVRRAIARLTFDEPQPEPPPLQVWRDGITVTDPRRGYLQQLDTAGLADWAAEQNTRLRLLVRPGDYVFPGAPIAVMLSEVEGAAAAISKATAVSEHRASSADLEFSVRQLVEVAVRALSPGINDPHTAMSVLDRLGAALCDLAARHLSLGVTLSGGQPALVVPAIDYGGLTDAMFHMIRQNAAGSAAVLIRQIEVLTAAVACERTPARQAELQRHADLVLGDAERDVSTPDDLEDIRKRHARFDTVRLHGPVVGLCDIDG
ncbi:DUF2254 domain-containing protein [Acidisoma sp.]|uniref:DUF2254 domain-containing protein n=1 Tax=Acidisoma sp. TaxID=1872115 RepID=UPI003B008276